MKKLLLGLLVLSTISGSAFASSIHLICTNASGSIVLEEGVGKFKKPWFEQEDSFVTLDQGTDFKMSGEKISIAEKKSCSMYQEDYVLKAKFERTGAGDKMPSTSSVYANEDGTLTETLLCRRTMSWMGTCNE
jgi:hypothetical protein